MRTVWHIMLKDARRLWLPLALWMAFITGHGYWDWTLVHAAPPVTSHDAAELERMKFFALLFFAVRLLTGYVLAATLTLEDPPTGTSTFWLTRPISGARMLGAKVIGCLLLFIALPALVSLPWLAAGASIGEGLRLQAGMAAVALVVAAFAGSLGKFIAWTVGLIPVVGSLLLYREWSPVNFRLMATTPAVSAVFICVGVAVFVQYQMRRRALALTLLGASALGAMATVFYWAA